MVPMFAPWYEGSAAQRVAGFVLFLALAWFTILKPAWFGLRQALGQVDPLAEAMGGIRRGLRGIFADIKCLDQASSPGLIARAAGRAVVDILNGRAADAAKDAGTLIGRAGTTYREYLELWAPRLEALEGASAREMIVAVHGFWSWLTSPAVLPVVQAAGRRFGLGEDVAEERRLRIAELVSKHAPSLAHGFWYGLYATIVFQLLVLEALMVWGSPRQLAWTACVLAAFNVVKGILILRDGARLWPVRMEAGAVAAAIGIPDLAAFALKLLAGQAMGAITMLLLVVRFLALGEALHRPGNVLSGLHQVLAWTWGFYLEMARLLV